jgi:hypothetical protein
MAKINRKRLLDRQYNQRDARLCVIAVEGAVDEAQYFKSFGSRRLKVEILKTESDNKSAPKYVFQRLDEFSAKHDLDDQDMLWLVMDVDRWGADQLSRLSRESTQKGYQLAISNPCFEVWLCLHFEDLNPQDKTSKNFKARLGSIRVTHQSSPLDFSALLRERLPDAIARAKALHPDSQDYWPQTIGSHIYRLMDAIRPFITL